MEQKETTSQPEAKIQWHPAFCAATEIELRENKDDLNFHSEYNLSKKPLQMDLLIVEKQEDVVIINDIGHIFKRYNVIEYKSPEDNLNIDDFFKTLAYAYLYKGLGKNVDQIPLKELTISLFRERKPIKMIKDIMDCGCTVEEYADGIYYVKGLLIPAQIVVIRELRKQIHSTLRVFSKDVKEDDIQAFLEYVKRFTEPGEKANADAVIQVSVSANREKYEEVRRNSSMCEALRLLMKDEIEEELKNTRKEGNKEGINNMAALTKMLLDENRMDDLRKCTEDVAYRNQLLHQMQKNMEV